MTPINELPRMNIGKNTKHQITKSSSNLIKDVPNWQCSDSSNS